MPRWKRPNKTSVALILKPASLLEDEYDQAEVGSRKEQLLRQSLKMVKTLRNRDEALCEIVEKAIAGCLYNIAVDAIKVFPSDSTDQWRFLYATSELLSLDHWRWISPSLLNFLENRVLQAMETSWRSEALAQIGLFRLLAGDQQSAFMLWESAEDGRVVDKAISSASVWIISKDSDLEEASLALVEFISSKTVKAQAIAEIAGYLS